MSRAIRRPPERYAPKDERSLWLRFHTQTAGSTLTAQQPENNLVRVGAQAISAIYGGAQSIHTNGFDEALALPTERSATLALRTQQILMHEAGTTATADPLGGSWYVEALTDELEARARELIEEGAKKALSDLKAVEPYDPGKPCEVKVEFISTSSPQKLRFQPGVEAVDDRTIVSRADDWWSAWKQFFFV